MNIQKHQLNKNKYSTNYTSFENENTTKNEKRLIQK